MAQPTMPSNDLLDQAISLIKIVGPFVLTIVSLITWAWKRMEKSQDKLEETLSKHVEEDDKIHDRLFTQNRDYRKDLDQLIGEHKATHKGGK